MRRFHRLRLQIYRYRISCRLARYSIRRYWLSREHRGEKYICPICGFRSQDLGVLGQDGPAIAKYHPIAMGMREGKCFRCGATDKEKLVWLYLRQEYGVLSKRNIKVLHMAPERETAKRLKRLFGRNYIAGDFFTEDYIRNYPNYVRKMDVCDLPFEDNSFDLVICNHVMEHLSDDRLGMRELYRVLKPGGTAIIQAPLSLQLEKTLEDPACNTEELRYLEYGQSNHLRLYGIDYKERLVESGFHVEYFDFPKEIKQQYGLAEKEYIHLCFKQGGNKT